MDAERIVSSNQEQAVAAWIGYLNQVRIDRMLAEFAQQDHDLAAAVEAMSRAVSEIDALIDVNRGGYKGVHGFIAEAAEVGIRNARSLVQGESASYVWVNDNGVADFLRAGQELQMKFSNAGGSFSLSAVMQHAEMYPDFISNGGKYVIPEDHYEAIRLLHGMSEREASRLVASVDGMTYRQWQQVKALFEGGSVSIDDLEPAATGYADVQVGTIHQTMDEHTKSIKEQHQARRNASYERSKPTLHEGAKATAAAAAIEGGTAFAMAIATKLRAGKRIRDLNSDDWADVAGESGKGLAKGGVRGASIYFLTNYTATSAAVASSVVTASFGVAEQAHLMRQGGITEEEFLANSELLCLDATVSAVSSFVGQAVIPVPVLGAVIGNTVGTVLYKIAKDGLSKQEQALVAAYAEAQRSLDEMLDARYQATIVSLVAGMRNYLALLDRALAPNPAVAFEGSIELARYLGVPDDDLLKSIDEIDDFFLA